MNLKFLLLLITSLFIISCVSVTENTEEDSEDPFELATGGRSVVRLDKWGMGL